MGYQENKNDYGDDAETNWKETAIQEKERANKYMAMMDELRMNYFKDLLNVRSYAEQLERHLKIGNVNQRPRQLNLSVEEVTIKNVQFFDQTDGIDLSDKSRQLMNDKLNKLVKDFNDRLIKLSLQNHLLCAQIKKFKILNEDQDGKQGRLFNFSDISTDKMVKKLLVVSDDPADIWFHFNIQQPGFFQKVIMNEYGLDQDFSKKVLSDFKTEASSLQSTFNDELQSVGEGYVNQIRDMTHRNHNLIKELTKTRMQIGPIIDILSDKIDNGLIEQFNGQMEDFLKQKSLQIDFKQQIIDKQYKQMNQLRERIIEYQQIVSKLRQQCFDLQKNHSQIKQPSPQQTGRSSSAFLTEPNINNSQTRQKSANKHKSNYVNINLSKESEILERQASNPQRKQQKITVVTDQSSVSRHCITASQAKDAPSAVSVSAANKSSKKEAFQRRHTIHWTLEKGMTLENFGTENGQGRRPENSSNSSSSLSSSSIDSQESRKKRRKCCEHQKNCKKRKESEQQEDEKSEKEENEQGCEKEVEILIEDLYIPNIDELEHQVAYYRFKSEKEHLIAKHWESLYCNEIKTFQELQERINYLLITIKENAICHEAQLKAQKYDEYYIKLLEGQIDSVNKQMEQRKIFNPLESAIILNPKEEMRRQAAKMCTMHKDQLLKQQKMFLGPRRFAQYSQTDFQNVKNEIICLPPGRKPDDLKPPNRETGTQAEPFLKNKGHYVCPKDLGLIPKKKHRETQTDLHQNKIYTQADIEKIREEEKNFFIARNGKSLDQYDSTLKLNSQENRLGDRENKVSDQSPDNQLANEDQSLKKGPDSKIITYQTKKLTAEPQTGHAICCNDKVLQVREHIMELGQHKCREKEMILKKIQENIQKQLKQHFKNKVIRKRGIQQLIPAEKESQVSQIQQEVQMINIQENKDGEGPVIDFQEQNEGLYPNYDSYSTVDHNNYNLDFRDYSILEDLKKYTEEKESDENSQKEIYAILEKQMKNLKTKKAQLRVKKSDKKKSQKSQHHVPERVIKVMPYGIRSLENFLEAKLNKQRKVSQSTQTEMTYQTSEALQTDLITPSQGAHKQILLNLYNKQVKQRNSNNQDLTKNTNYSSSGFESAKFFDTRSIRQSLAPGAEGASTNKTVIDLIQRTPLDQDDDYNHQGDHPTHLEGTESTSLINSQNTTKRDYILTSRQSLNKNMGRFQAIQSNVFNSSNQKYGNKLKKLGRVVQNTQAFNDEAYNENVLPNKRRNTFSRNKQQLHMSSQRIPPSSGSLPVNLNHSQSEPASIFHIPTASQVESVAEGTRQPQFLLDQQKQFVNNVRMLKVQEKSVPHDKLLTKTASQDKGLHPYYVQHKGQQIKRFSDILNNDLVGTASGLNKKKTSVSSTGVGIGASYNYEKLTKTRDSLSNQKQKYRYLQPPETIKNLELERKHRELREQLGSGLVDITQNDLADDDNSNPNKQPCKLQVLQMLELDHSQPQVTQVSGSQQPGTSSESRTTTLDHPYQMEKVQTSTTSVQQPQIAFSNVHGHTFVTSNASGEAFIENGSIVQLITPEYLEAQNQKQVLGDPSHQVSGSHAGSRNNTAHNTIQQKIPTAPSAGLRSGDQRSTSEDNTSAVASRMMVKGFGPGNNRGLTKTSSGNIGPSAEKSLPFRVNSAMPAPRLVQPQIKKATNQKTGPCKRERQKEVAAPYHKLSNFKLDPQTHTLMGHVASMEAENLSTLRRNESKELIQDDQIANLMVKQKHTSDSMDPMPQITGLQLQALQASSPQKQLPFANPEK